MALLFKGWIMLFTDKSLSCVWPTLVHRIAIYPVDIIIHYHPSNNRRFIMRHMVYNSLLSLLLQFGFCCLE